MVGELRYSLEHLLGSGCSEKKWDINALVKRKQEMFKRLAPPDGKLGARRVLDSLRAILPEDGIMACDVGAHLHLIGQQWMTPSPECQLMTNGGSSMGFAIPAAIAAKLSCPDRQVCCVVGDGGYMMMAGEMATAMRLEKNIVFVVVNDRLLSLISIKKERKGHGWKGTELYGDVVIKATESMFGVPVISVGDAREYDQALEQAFAQAGPVIVEVCIGIEDYQELVLRGNR